MGSLAKQIKNRHGHDPGVSEGFNRCYDGIVSARKGIKRVESLLRGSNGAREVALARERLDEAEHWLAAAVHGVKSESWPPEEAQQTHNEPIPAPDGEVCLYRVHDQDGWRDCGEPATLLRRHRRHGRRRRSPWPVCPEHAKRRGISG